MNGCDLRLKEIVPGREDLAPGYDLPRHQHLQSYAIIVIRGRFDQIGYAGRVRVQSGDLLIQPPLDCHSNRLVSNGARILRLPWEGVTGFGGVHELTDADAVIRAAERDLHEAAHLAWVHRAEAPSSRRSDWPDELAAALCSGEIRSLTRWAEERGLARETVSRGFSSAYGVDARQFRAEVRARAAWLRIVGSPVSFAAIAAEAGYADQAHMSRSVRALTGLPPSAWRRDPRIRRLGVPAC